MLWQIPLLLVLLSAEHIATAAVVANKANKGYAVTLPIHRQNISNRQFKSMQKRSILRVPITNAVTHYVASVGVGSPAIQYNLIVDTGLANTIVGGSEPYFQTSTSVEPDVNGGSTDTTFTYGNASGYIFYDQVTLASGLVIEKQLIGVAKIANGFEGFDGVLGLGPVDLTEHMSNAVETIPTVTDNLFSQGKITQNMFALSCAPSTQGSETNGEITFGGTDDTKFTGSITYVPITKTQPSSEHWGIDASISYGTGGTPILPATAGIIDSRASFILLATDAYNAYKQATGAIEVASNGMLSITLAQLNALQSLHFTIGSQTYELTPNAQIFPRSLNTHIDLAANKIFLNIGEMGQDLGQGAGLDFILGKAFLERFYTVFDTANRRIGIATTPFTNATTN
ncbi:unnamed protein product [Umbelopsis ramanniana]